MRFRADSFRSSFRFAGAGLAFMWRTQRNFRVHAIATAGAVSAGVTLDCPAIEMAIILLVCTGVVVCEMLNTAIENAVDLATRDRHPLAKAAKDVAAGAVLASALTAAGVGALILGPRAWSQWGPLVLSALP
jgi:diacylglycerol kinase